MIDNGIFKITGLFFIIFGLTVVITQEAYMGQVHEESITLSDLVRDADSIFVADKLDPFMTCKDIEIGEDRTKYPPFKKAEYHFKVREELIAPKGVSMTGKDIIVALADSDADLEMHRRYYLEGAQKSPIHRSYETGAGQNDAALIIFLKHSGGNNFIFVAHNSYESLKKRKRISGLIKDKIKRGAECESINPTD